MITLAIQKKGRLYEDTIKLLVDAGFRINRSPKGLLGFCEGFPLKVIFLRAKDVPELVADNVADVGICGEDTLALRKDAFQILLPLGFGKCRFSIAVPESFSGDLSDLSRKRIATSYPELLQPFLKKKGIKAELIHLAGSVEVAPKLGIAEAIADLVSTGQTLKMHGLKELESIFASQAVLFSKNPLQTPEGKDFLARIKSVILARRFKYIVMNLPETSLEAFAKAFPGRESPTVTPLKEAGWVSVATVLEEKAFWEDIQHLKSLGAKDILVLPIEKMIP